MSEQTNKRIAAFAGSFDPVTIGHADLIARASKLYDEVIVLVSSNAEKREVFRPEEKKAWVEKACTGLHNVQVLLNEGIAVEKAQSLGASVMLRGVRNGADFEYEANMAWMNQNISRQNLPQEYESEHGMETVCLFSRPEYSFISSSNVRELLRCRLSCKGLVPDCILEEVSQAFDCRMKQ